ncbi:MAG: hypothetical protein IT458_02570 [Planctomycetes bacterium]|nr:hypothetical protein [Planctomycetota bacterium]
MNTASLAGAACLLAASLAAQRFIVNPPANATVEASSRISFPFAGSASIRFQQICALSAISTAAGIVDQVSFRRDNDTVVASGNYLAFSPDFTLTVSTSPRTPLTMSKSFAANVGADVKQVHTGPVNWPAQNKVPPGPTPFAYTVPFSTPFLYLNTNGDFLIDLAINSPNNTNTLYFSDANSSSVGSASLNLGSGCPGGFNLVVVYDNWGPGATARILQYSAAGNVQSVLGLGSTSPVWGGLPLPVDLGVIGAAGCNVYHDLLVAIPGSTSGTSGQYNGRWDQSMEIPNLPGLAALKLRAQFFNLGDTGAGNAANLSVSSGHEITLATPTPGRPPQSEAHASGLTKTTADLLQQGYGMVVEFRLQ